MTRSGSFAKLDAAAGSIEGGSRGFLDSPGQADYIYSNYSHIFPSTHPTRWNSVRLRPAWLSTSAIYYARVGATCSAQPTEGIEGEPITVTATVPTSIPKHTGPTPDAPTVGKLGTANAQSAKIDTTGVAAERPIPQRHAHRCQDEEDELGDLRRALHRQGEADETRQW